DLDDAVAELGIESGGLGGESQLAHGLQVRRNRVRGIMDGGRRRDVGCLRESPAASRYSRRSAPVRQTSPIVAESVPLSLSAVLLDRRLDLHDRALDLVVGQVALRALA